MNHTESVTIQSKASLSDCGQYRYWLSRIWDENKPIGAFVCKNPSKATSVMCDQTLCNINNLAVQWGWGGFYIINLFAFMATDPVELPKQNDPVGPFNDEAIMSICNKANNVVLAWGNGNTKRANHVKELLNNHTLFCIAKNKDGGYLHPSRIKSEDYSCPIAI